MIRVLLLRFEAPLISFGAPMVDHHGVVQAIPALSMITGLLANALGVRHGEHARLQHLQERVRFAVRTDRTGEALMDYQIADLGQPWMDPETSGWTTHGKIMKRDGASGEGLHIRYRHYRADSVHTVALSLEPAAKAPTLDDLAMALKEPARPLFLGRKTCLPSAQILIGVIDAESLVAALARSARATRSDRGPLDAWWDDGEDESAAIGASNIITVTDERDWKNQIHTGRRLVRQGRVDPPAEDHHA